MSGYNYIGIEDPESIYANTIEDWESQGPGYSVIWYVLPEGRQYASKIEEIEESWPEWGDEAQLDKLSSKTETLKALLFKYVHLVFLENSEGLYSKSSDFNEQVPIEELDNAIAWFISSRQVHTAFQVDARELIKRYRQSQSRKTRSATPVAGESEILPYPQGANGRNLTAALRARNPKLEPHQVVIKLPFGDRPAILRPDADFESRDATISAHLKSLTRGPFATKVMLALLAIYDDFHNSSGDFVTVEVSQIAKALNISPQDSNLKRIGEALNAMRYLSVPVVGSKKGEYYHIKYNPPIVVSEHQERVRLFDAEPSELWSITFRPGDYILTALYGDSDGKGRLWLRVNRKALEYNSQKEGWAIDAALYYAEISAHHERKNGGKPKIFRLEVLINQGIMPKPKANDIAGWLRDCEARHDQLAGDGIIHDFRMIEAEGARGMGRITNGRIEITFQAPRPDGPQALPG